MQKEQIEYWRKHPDKFLQDVYGVKLKWYQRILLHYMNRQFNHKVSAAARVGMWILYYDNTRTYT